MHQNTFWTTPDVKNNFFKAFIPVVWKYVQMHKNMFLTTPDVKKYIKCIKTETLENNFF
jgi:hypothetical protein